ncbi:hypothetical protein QOZ80_2AG0149570 [Eleusine coracana subsp. coracana]|nr:hypothetical protein QOZ80_2AG0149570 [Eleusine coracana subsp. coracana]
MAVSNNSIEKMDMISELPDDILRKILWAVTLAGDAHAAARTCVLSRRWRPLPSSMTRLHVTNFSLDAGDFFSLNGRQIATAEFTTALRRFLAVPATKRTVGMLSLRFIFTKHERDHNVRRIGAIVGDAVDDGRVISVELEIVGQILPDGGIDEFLFLDEAPTMLGYGECFRHHLLRPGSSFREALVKLSLQNVWFHDPAAVNDLVRECSALRFLSLTVCGFLSEQEMLDMEHAAGPAVLTIDAPQSRLTYLQCIQCYIHHVDLVQAPELHTFRCQFCCLREDDDDAFSPPVSFGYTPSLKVLLLSRECYDDDDDVDLKLSDVLIQSAPLEVLLLGFGNGKIDDHICETSSHKNSDENADLEWKPSPGFNHHHLKRLWMFRTFHVEKNLPFARLVMGLAVNLQTLTLQVMDLGCQQCKDDQRESPKPGRSRSEHVDALVKELKHGIQTSTKITILFTGLD